MRVSVLALPLLLTLTACNAFAPREKGSPFLQTVRQVQADGSATTVGEKGLSVFQGYMRARLSGGMGATSPMETAAKKSGWDLLGGGQAQSAVVGLFLLEVEVPEGEGHEGAYAAVVLLGDGRTGRVERGEFQYYEQANHQPRYDRYFHRPLTAAELGRVQAFMRAHPVETLRVVPRAGGEADGGGIGFRVTRATAKGAAAVVMIDPAATDRPAMDAVELFAGLRDAPAPLACTYLRAIPVNAAILFAHPQHRAVAVWTGGEEVRALIDPPLRTDRVALRPVDAAAEEASDPAPVEPQWYAWRDGAWVPAVAPTGRAATQPAAAVAETRPLPETISDAAAGLSFPRLPRRPSTGELLAQLEARPEPLPGRELWHAERRVGHTMFTHYVPRLADERVRQGESVQMIIPGLEFDSTQMALNRGRGLLYVIHDGHVVALPLPAAVVR